MKIYSAKYRCGSSFFTVLRESFQQVIQYRWQILLAIKKRIQSTYQQDAFGFFWSIIMPIIPMTVYMILAHIKVFNTVKDQPFIYYIAMGMMVWLMMASIIQNIMISIKKEKGILTTTNFPIIASIISQLGSVLYETAIRIIAVVAVIIWFGIDTSFQSVVLSILSLIPAIIFAFALGMLLSILDIVIQDTRRIVDIFLRYGLFISSVIFPFPTDCIIGSINQFNFFNTYINATRDILYSGTLENLSLFVYTSIFGLLLFMISLKLVYSMEYKIRAYL
ncbi:MAG: ABC transporter permease [Campylobacterota bacterium]|nr:ABC transporter permease [Campylobacterota bacterium]